MFVSRGRFEDAQKRIAELTAEVADLKARNEKLVDRITAGSGIKPIFAEPAAPAAPPVPDYRAPGVKDPEDVPKAKPIRTIDDVRRWAEKNADKRKLVHVRPASTVQEGTNG